MHHLHLLHFSALELSYISRYGYIAFFVIFALGEVLGFIPLGLLLVAMGALSRQHVFTLWVVFACALVASLLGSYVLYWIARRVGKHRIYQERIKDSALAARIEAHMQTRPWLTVFATRFIGIACYPTTLISGLVGVRKRTFLSAVAIGNGLCIALYLGIGYIVGGAWERDARLASHIAFWFVITVLSGYVLYYLFTKLRETHSSA
jgi:membrane protein DedA with SNARE-associated domain